MLPAENDPSTARMTLLHAHLARVDRARKLGFAAAPFDADSPVPCLLLVAPVLKLIDHGLELKIIDAHAAQSWFMVLRRDLLRALFHGSSPLLVRRSSPFFQDIDPLILSTLNATSGLLARGLIDDAARLGMKPREGLTAALACSCDAAVDIILRSDQLNHIHRMCVWQYATLPHCGYH